MKALFALAAGLLWAANASAVLPAAGLWWNPSESGRGFTIDYQNGLMVVTAYTYNADRTATFLQASGNFDETQSTFTGTLVAATNGQCFGCTYSSPTRSAAGTLSINFSSGETGVATFPGGSTPIQHTIYGYADQNAYLYGEWAFEYASSSANIYSDWVVFNNTYTGSDGTFYIAGSMDSRSGTAALGRYVNGQFIVIVSDGTLDDIFEFPRSDDQRMLGYGGSFVAGGTAINPTRPAVGNRLFSQAGLQKLGSVAADPVSAQRTEHLGAPSIEQQEIYLNLESKFKSLAN